LVDGVFSLRKSQERGAENIKNVGAWGAVRKGGVHHFGAA
jgi:hypothetical protein